MSKLMLMGEELEFSNVQVSFVAFSKGVLGTVQLISDGQDGHEILYAVTRLFETDEWSGSEDMGVGLLMDKLREDLLNEGGFIVKTDDEES